jgi:poly(A) polymerase
VNAGARRIDAEWLKQSAAPALLEVLDRDGEEARVVGGAVRNALLDVPVGDVDIATTALPQEVIRRVEAAGFRAVPTGIEHGTITVVIDSEPHEVTTLREDVETYGRHAKVAFGRDWRRDAERRDFTMNALSVGRDFVVHDYVGGLTDIAARRVRFIGRPQARIAEDYLRVLRFFRFHAAYGAGEPDPEGLAACIAARAHLDHLSRERVRMEILKLIVAPRAVPTLGVMAEAGLIELVLAGVPLIASLDKMAGIEATLDLPADPVRRLGALALFVTEDADRLRERLKLSNVEYERLCSMADGWWRVAPEGGETEARALLYRLGRERFLDRFLLAWSRAGAGVADHAWRALALLPHRWNAPAFPLKAADFLKRGLARGPALGAALRGAEEAWIAQGFPSDPASIAAIADGAVAQTKRG